jgi:hypothetical protein
VWAYLGRAAVCFAAALAMIGALAVAGLGIAWWVSERPNPIDDYVAAVPHLGGSYARQAVALGFQVCADLYADTPAPTLAEQYRATGVRGVTLEEPDTQLLIDTAVHNLCPDAPAPGLLPG